MPFFEQTSGRRYPVVDRQHLGPPLHAKGRHQALALLGRLPL